MGDSHSSEGPRGGGSRNNNRNRNRNQNGGRGGNGGRNRNQGGNPPREWKPSGNRESRKPEPKSTFIQKLLGFFGIGKKTAATPKKGGAQNKGPKGGNDRPKQDRPKRDHTPVPVTSGRLFVGNLDYNADEAALKSHFETIGAVKSAEIVMNPHNGKSKGFAFVEMESIDDAKKAVADLHEKDFLSRRLLVGGAKSRGPRTGDDDRGERRERRERPPREGGRGGGRERSGGRNDRGGRNERGGRREKPKPQHADSGDPAMKPIAIETVTGPALQISNLSSDFSAEDLSDLLEGIGTLASSEIGSGSAQIVMNGTEEA